MSGRDKERQHLLRDLRHYLQQRQDEGWEWYLDAGPVAADSLVAARPEPVRPRQEKPHQSGPKSDHSRSQPSQSRNEPPTHTVRPAAKQQAVERSASQPDDFTRQCEVFVAEALARLEDTTPQVAQTDIFSPQVEASRTLSLAEKEAALNTLAAEVAPCQLCKLHSGRTQTVFGVGHPDADLVFIGEAPGRDEDRLGEPFVGRAGKLLTEILKAIDFEREDVYICNILKCRPPKNRDPEREEVDACEPYLKSQLEILTPKIICCLGRVAAQTLLGTRASLTAMRETLHFYAGIPVMVTYHPAALLRNPHWKRPTWDDVRKLRALYDALRG